MPTDRYAPMPSFSSTTSNRSSSVTHELFEVIQDFGYADAVSMVQIASRLDHLLSHLNAKGIDSQMH